MSLSLSLSRSFFFFLLFHRGGQKFETDNDVGDDTDARVRGEVREKLCVPTTFDFLNY